MVGIVRALVSLGFPSFKLVDMEERIQIDEPLNCSRASR